MATKAVALPTRTALQSGAAFVVVEGIDAFLFDMTERQYGAAVALITLGICIVQNLAERFSGKALLVEEPPA